MNRKEFIVGSSAAALTGCIAKSGAVASARRPGVPRFHVFSKMFQPPVTRDPAALCDLFAAAGYDGVQWTVRPGGHCEPAEVAEKLPMLVKTAASRGLACETICTAITDGNDPTAHRIAAVAAECGIRQLRTGYCFYQPEKESFAMSMERFRRVFAAFERLGSKTRTKLVYQNHSTWGPAIFGGTVWDIHDVICDLDPDCIGIEYDPMHAFLETYLSWPRGMELVAPWIAAIDLKDFHYTPDRKNPKLTYKAMVAAGEGIVPWAEVADIVRRCGVDPLYVLHFEYDFDRTNLDRTVKTELETFRRELT